MDLGEKHPDGHGGDERPESPLDEPVTEDGCETERHVGAPQPDKSNVLILLTKKI